MNNLPINKLVSLMKRGLIVPENTANVIQSSIRNTYGHRMYIQKQAIGLNRIDFKISDFKDNTKDYSCAIDLQILNVEKNIAFRKSRFFNKIISNKTIMVNYNIFDSYPMVFINGELYDNAYFEIREYKTYIYFKQITSVPSIINRTNQPIGFTKAEFQDLINSGNSISIILMDNEPVYTHSSNKYTINNILSTTGNNLTLNGMNTNYTLNSQTHIASEDRYRHDLYTSTDNSNMVFITKKSTRLYKKSFVGFTNNDNKININSLMMNNITNGDLDIMTYKLFDVSFIKSLIDTNNKGLIVNETTGLQFILDDVFLSKNMISENNFILFIESDDGFLKFAHNLKVKFIGPNVYDIVRLDESIPFPTSNIIIVPLFKKSINNELTEYYNPFDFLKYLYNPTEYKNKVLSYLSNNTLKNQLYSSDNFNYNKLKSSDEYLSGDEYNFDSFKELEVQPDIFYQLKTIDSYESVKHELIDSLHTDLYEYYIKLTPSQRISKRRLNNHSEVPNIIDFTTFDSPHLLFVLRNNNDNSNVELFLDGVLIFPKTYSSKLYKFIYIEESLWKEDSVLEINKYHNNEFITKLPGQILSINNTLVRPLPEFPENILKLNINKLYFTRMVGDKLQYVDANVYVHDPSIQTFKVLDDDLGIIGDVKKIFNMYCVIHDSNIDIASEIFVNVSDNLSITSITGSNTLYIDTPTLKNIGYMSFYKNGRQFGPDNVTIEYSDNIDGPHKISSLLGFMDNDTFTVSINPVYKAFIKKIGDISLTKRLISMNKKMGLKTHDFVLNGYKLNKYQIDEFGKYCIYINNNCPKTTKNLYIISKGKNALNYNMDMSTAIDLSIYEPKKIYDALVPPSYTPIGYIPTDDEIEILEVFTNDDTGTAFVGSIYTGSVYTYVNKVSIDTT
jgi:hypothetical protein